MEPITREEQFLAKAAGDNVNIPEPITREEVYLKRIAENGGGGGGTSNYEQLLNQPQINGVTLVGNKSADDLNLASKTDVIGKADKVTNATSGHLAGLDSNGNLTDSGVSPTEEVTVEGNPVTFESPFEQDAKSVVVSVKPIQDLHGYDHPWVGGAGYNQWDEEWEVGAILGGNGQNTTSTTKIRSKNYIPVTADQQYYYKHSSTESDLFFYDSNKDYLGYSSSISMSTSGVFTAPANAVYMRFSILQTTYNNDIAVNYPSSVTTYSPYSNICPIIGIDELEIVDRGENFFANLTKDTSKGYIDNYYLTSNGSTAQSGGYYVSEYLEIKPNTAYYIGGILGNAPALCYYDSNKTYISGVQYANQESITDTSPSNAKYMRLSVLKANESLYMVRYASAIVTTTIPLPSTLYGGEVDVTNGDAPENMAIIDMGDCTWYKSGDRYQTDISGKKNAPSAFVADNILCTALEVIDGDSVVNDTTLNGVIGSSTQNSRIFARITGFESADAFKTAMTGQKICYELATPTTISFDPTDVELLEGTNVVTTNGEKVAVTYGRSLWQDINDLKTNTDGKLDKLDVADVEGANASKPYSVNEFMLRSDGFYKVTQPIASGASITASNTTKTTIGAVLTALLNA